MIPFDCFFLYPLWPEEHMRPAMEATAKAAVDWVCLQAVVAYHGSVEACEKHRRKLNLIVLVGAHVGMVHLSRALFAAAVVLNLFWVCFVYKTWAATMGPQDSKFLRTDPACPSFRTRPETTRCKRGDPIDVRQPWLADRMDAAIVK